MGTIPFSNPAGNNQTSPGAKSNVAGVTPVQLPGGTAKGNNPYTPVVTAGTPTSVGAATGNTGTTSAQNGFITSNTSTTNGQNNLANQLDDIYGQGVGASLFSLLNGMSGTNSQILQEYISSLAPQEATAQANTNAALGAGGVGANSSVAAIADSNLQSQEFSAIASESANLTQSQEQLTAQILSGTENAATKEVASSGWTTFGDVMGDITSDVGSIFGGKAAFPGSSQATGAASSSIPSGTSAMSNTLANATVPNATDAGVDDGMELAAFA